MQSRQLTLISLFFLVLTPFVYADSNDPLDSLEDDTAKANFCFYTRSIELQHAAASGLQPLKLLGMAQTAKSWEAIVNTLMPNKKLRREEMMVTLGLFNARTTDNTEAGLESTAAQQAAIQSSTTSCAQLLSELQSKDLQPRSQAEIFTSTAKPDATSYTPAEPNRAPAKQPMVIERSPDAPFHKDVFAPGWRGDLLWQGSAQKERAVLISLDNIPPGKDAVAIHANLRIFGGKAREHCVEHLVETGSAPDESTLYLQPADGNTCGPADRVVSLYAIAADRLRMEIRDAGIVVAAGDFQPTAYAARLNIQAQPLSPTPVVPLTTLASSTHEDAVKPSPPQHAAPSRRVDRNCLTCLPIETRDVASDDLLRGLLGQPLKGRFHWDWHQTSVPLVHAQGTLRRTSAAAAVQHTFSLALDSEYGLVCVGTLRETGRSAGGYIMHLTADDPTRRCDPLVTHGYLLPFAPRDPSKADFLWIQLFNSDDKLISSAIIRSDLFKPAVTLDSSKAQLAMDTLAKMEDSAENGRKNQKFAAFELSPDYDRIAPLYQGCMKVAPDIFGVDDDSAYCQCLSQKFGIGPRLSDADLARYSRDITPLIKLIRGPETQETKLHKRLGETCRQCSFPDNELEPWCSERDSMLYVANDYATMIRLLDTDEPIVEATEYYRKVFFRTYLQGYSTRCPSYIVDPVSFEYIVTEFRPNDPWASRDGEVTQRNETLVARTYAAKYKRFYDEINAPPDGASLSGTIRSAAITNEGELRRAFRDGQQRVNTERENYSAIRQNLNKGCDSTAVKRVYSNLLNLVD